MSPRRRALILASNGPSTLTPLKYATHDAERVNSALRSVDPPFEVVKIRPGSDVFEVRQAVARIADSCTSEDSMIIYFSGHGDTSVRGKLMLLWDNSTMSNPLETTIPVSEIMQAMDLCKAGNKLLILDCCHAGAATDIQGFKTGAPLSFEEIGVQSETSLVLLASSRVESARELDELRGSFLTVKLCEALESKSPTVDFDRDGRLSVHDLTRWLESQAIAHNYRDERRSVPIPYLVGKSRGSFYFSRIPLWIPFFGLIDNNVEVVVLPTESDWAQGRGWRSTSALCAIGRFPVTNGQYRKFIEEVGASEPVGEILEGDQWSGPFYPWRDDRFSNPDQPVVCVNYREACVYCDWLGAKILEDASIELSDGDGHHLIGRSPGSRHDRRLLCSVATLTEWTTAAFGPTIESSMALVQFSARGSRFDGDLRGQQELLGRVGYPEAPTLPSTDGCPAAIDPSGCRDNSWGVSDLFGNVWQWVTGRDQVSDYVRPKLGIGTEYEDVEVRGGGFYDPMDKISPMLHSLMLRDGTNTAHADLGFRLAVPIEEPTLLEKARIYFDVRRARL